MAMGRSGKVPGRGEITPDTLAALCSTRGEPALTTAEICSITQTPRCAVADQLEWLQEQGKIAADVDPDGERWWWTPA